MYVSRCEIPLADRPDAMMALMDVTRLKNRDLGVTGCLSLSGDVFVQVIEGERSVIEPLLLRIEADPRHSALQVRMQREVRGRSFPDWRMAYLDVAAQATTSLGDPFTTPPAVLLAQMISLADSIGPPTRV